MPPLRRLGTRLTQVRRWAARTFLQPKSIHISYRPAGTADREPAPR